MLEMNLIDYSMEIENNGGQVCKSVRLWEMGSSNNILAIFSRSKEKTENFRGSRAHSVIVEKMKVKLIINKKCFII